ncbi:MAG: hypothetical protein FWG80_02270 [Alphaproteobacteria bacterium]|nr:hypothetical protein [Alphaproteobacteria bacterium]
MQTLKQILNIIFPFAITILLWRMSAPVWNPCGILVMVPVFYYSFVRPRSEFLPMAIIGSLILDYNFDTMLFWTILFCAAYAAHYFQTALRGAVQRAGGFWAFSAFMCFGLFSLGISAGSLQSIGTAAWTLMLTMAGYCIWIRIIK